MRRRGSSQNRFRELLGRPLFFECRFGATLNQQGGLSLSSSAAAFGLHRIIPGPSFIMIWLIRRCPLGARSMAYGGRANQKLNACMALSGFLGRPRAARAPQVAPGRRPRAIGSRRAAHVRVLRPPKTAQTKQYMHVWPFQATWGARGPRACIEWRWAIRGPRACRKRR